MPNIMQDLGTKIGSEFKTHRLRIEAVETDKQGNLVSGTNIKTINGTSVLGPGDIVTTQTTISGNAGTATKLQTARTISLTGDVTGNVSFDGSANVSITATVADDSHNHVISNVDGLQVALDNKVDTVSKQSLDSNSALRVSGTTVSLYKGDGTFDSITTQDTVYTLPTATSTVKGGIEIFSDTVQTVASNTVSTTAGRTYGIQLNSAGQAVVNVPWSDNNTVYAHPNSGVTAGTYSKVTVNAQGHVTTGASLSASDIPSLDASKITSGTIDPARLPSFVDDVLEFANLAGFPTTGEAGKIYIALDTNKSYRWSGSTYVYITSGAVDSVAGKTGVVTLVKDDVGLGNVDNTADSTKNVLSATKLTTARTITLSGGVSGNTSFDGSGNVSLVATVANDSHTHAFTNLTSKPTTLQGYGINPEELPASIDLDTKTITGLYSQSQNSEATLVLNYPVATAGLLEVFAYSSMIHQRYWAYNTDDIYYRAKYNAGAWTPWTKGANVNDNVLSATKLQTARTIELSGGATGTATSFDGTGNISIPVTGLNASNLSSGTVPDDRLSGVYSGMSLKLNSSNTVFTTESSGSTNISRTVYGLAEYKNNASTTTGAIVFIAPSSPNAVMHQLEVSGLLYGKNIVSLIVQGYRTTGAWSDLRKISTGTADIQVRWGVTPDGKNCLILGDVGTAWPYPHIAITRAMFSYSGLSDAYCTGWTVALVTDFTGYTNISANISDSTMTGNVSTATKLQTARTINGVSFDGTADIVAPTNLTVGTITTTEVPIESSSGTNASIPAATTELAGVMTAADKVKLDGIATGATANTGTVTSVATSGAITGGTITSSGTISHSTADGYLHVPATGTTNNGKVLMAGATAGSLSWTALPSAPVTSVAGKTGVVTLVKDDVGLGNVDNTADSTKNVLSATKLTTARTIGGVSFDGTANINLPGVNTAGNQNTTGNAATATNAEYATTAGSSSALSGFTNTNNLSPINPNDTVQNTIGYAVGLSLLGQTDGAVYSQAYNASWQHQIYGDYRTGKLAVRGKNSGTWTPWKEIATTDGTVATNSSQALNTDPLRIVDNTLYLYKGDGTSDSVAVAAQKGTATVYGGAKFSLSGTTLTITTT